MARREAERRDGRVPGEEPGELAIGLCSLGPPGERLEQRPANTLEAHADFAAVVEEPFGDGWAVARGEEERRGILVGKWVEAAGNVTHRLFTDSLQAPIVHGWEKKKGRPGIRERFGYAVKARLGALGPTQEDLADKDRIHRTYPSDVERGTRNVSLVNIERLAGALQMKISELFATVEQG